MRFVPRSLAGRLLGIAAITTVITLAFAAVSIGHVLERFVVRGVDTQLDAQLVILSAAIGPDGRFDTTRGVPSFGPPEEGWSWRVDGPAEQWSSAGPRRCPASDRDIDRARKTTTIAACPIPVKAKVPTIFVSTIAR